MNEVIGQAITTLRTSPDLEDVEIFRILVKRGVQRRTAARLVEFLPMVYCRLILAKCGARFPDKYRRILSDGMVQQQIELIQEIQSDAFWQDVTNGLSSRLRSRPGALIIRI